MTDLRLRLQTICNVSAAHPRNLKRGRDDLLNWTLIAKKQKSSKSKLPLPSQQVEQSVEEDHDDVQETESHTDAFKHHFAAENSLLSPSVIKAVHEGLWERTESVSPSMGRLVHLRVPTADQPMLPANINPKILSGMYRSLDGDSKLPKELLDIVSSYTDLMLPQIEVQQHHITRAVLAAHAMSHIIKTRNRVLRNNEQLAAETKDAGPASAQAERRDQGFTRPKVLILLPFRNSAKAWVDHLEAVALSTAVENQARFDAECSLPEDSVDKLAQDDAALKYAPDHIANFKGNIDDSFRFGIKVTRKTLKIFSEFYSSDIILASPLGLRMSVEKEGDSDYLSSIEMVIVDQADVMTMQNWEHLQYVMDLLNKIPAEAHGADFSRIKPWYLDGHASKLRQTVVLSFYETPEIRSLFSSLNNVAGRARSVKIETGMVKYVKRGVKQIFRRFDSGGQSSNEDDLRFDFFKSQTLPTLLQSAVASNGNTLIFVPSYFDFLRVRDHLKTVDDLEFACISEYSSTSDVSKARNAFLSGKLPILVITERFHFFHRYRLRGIRHIIFYALPDRAAIYREMLSLPFETVPDSKYPEPEAADVYSDVAFCKNDLLRLERVVGTKAARKMLLSDDTKTTFS